MENRTPLEYKTPGTGVKCCQILLLGRPAAGDDCDCDCDCDLVIFSFYVVVVVVSSVGPSVSSVNHSDWAIHFFI